MICRHRTTLFGGVIAFGLLVAAPTLAGASELTLAELLNGGSMTACDTTFSNFRGYTSLGTGGASAADSGNIRAISLEDDCMNPGISWAGGESLVGHFNPPSVEAGEWDVNAGQTQQTSWLYDVIAGPGFLIKDNYLEFSAGKIGAGSVRIDESAQRVTGQLVAEKFVEFSNDLSQISDFREFPGQQILTISQTITLDGGADGAAGTPGFTQLFSQERIDSVPEPASVVLLITGLIGVGMRRYRRRR